MCPELIHPDDVVCSSACGASLRMEILAAARPPLTVGEWLGARLSRYRGQYGGDGRRHALLADGTRISIQASRTHYCTPQSNLGPYTHVEVSHEGPAEWAAYREPDGGVYGWLPIELVEGWCREHGGIVGTCVVEGSMGLLLTAAGVHDVDDLLPREAAAVERVAHWDPETVDALCFALTRVRRSALQRVSEVAAKTGSRRAPPDLRADALLAGATPREVMLAVVKGYTRRLRSDLMEHARDRITRVRRCAPDSTD